MALQVAIFYRVRPKDKLKIVKVSDSTTTVQNWPLCDWKTSFSEIDKQFGTIQVTPRLLLMIIIKLEQLTQLNGVGI